ncbi:membrane protein insertion efficiency factor YidD [Rickettsia oklahomensis]|uniref:Putative membrane protein insertion efficiency factor n=1 Tax=Rickettsia oklahomensis TaxID=3141789 RepID=A0AAU7BXZ9_9RICK
MTKILLLLIRFYQYFISPLLGTNCRFHPTCSEYAKEAIILDGSLLGLWSTFKRIIKCQPFYNGTLLYDTEIQCHSREKRNSVNNKEPK